MLLCRRNFQIDRIPSPFSTADQARLEKLTGRLLRVTGFNASSVHGALADLDLAPRIRQYTESEDLELAKLSAGLIVQMMSAECQRNTDRKRYDVFGTGVENVGEGLGDLIRQKLWL